MRTAAVGWMQVFLAVVFFSSLTGCTSEQRSPEQIQQRTARATAAIKRDTAAVAKGIKQGLANQQTVDINSASREELESLPGISAPLANKIIAGRPYANTDQLVTHRVVTLHEYDRIKKRVTAGK